MYDGEIKLISKIATVARDRRGQIVYSETATPIMCEVVPIARDEFFNGAQVGINPEFEFKINPVEYSGQKIIEYNGRRFSVYRSYQAGPDTLELYAEFVAGINGGGNDES